MRIELESSFEELVTWERGAVYYHPGYHEYYIAAVYHNTYLFVNLRTGIFLSDPYSTKEDAEARMQQDGMVKVPAKLVIGRNPARRD